MKTTLITLFVLCTSVAHAAGPATQPATVDVTIRPAAEPRPALRYRLLPPVVDTITGDAAPLYLLAAGAWPQGDANFADKTLTPEEVAKWQVADGASWSTALLEVPLSKLKSPELDRCLANLSGAYPMLQLASLRETCNWNLPIREQGFATLLPHLATLRNVARLVCLKARAEVARGDFDAAIATLRVNFALARNLDRDPVLIQQLVAAAIARMSLERIAEAIGQPGCPNLYWALADLPRPLFDSRRALEMERAAVYWSLPELRKVKDGSFTDRDWQTMVMRLEPMIGMDAQPQAKPKLENKLTMFAAALMAYPAARKHFIDRGMTAEQVDAMPKTTAIARYYVESYEEVYDEMVKWAMVPHWQSREGAKRFDNMLGRRVKEERSNLLMLVIPAVQKAVTATRKVDRHAAALQTVEAIRGYAAANEGKLPPTLAAITEMPVPNDPFTGKPMVYTVDGDTAKLESLQVDQPTDGLVVKLTAGK